MSFYPENLSVWIFLVIDVGTGEQDQTTSTLMSRTCHFTLDKTVHLY